MWSVRQRALLEFLPFLPSLLTSSDEKWANGPLILLYDKPANGREHATDWYRKGSCGPNKVMWVTMRGSIFPFLYGLILFMSGVKVWCWGKLIWVQGLEIQYLPGNYPQRWKRRREKKMSWLTDLRVCVYSLLVSCQTLHAWFPKGLGVFTTAWRRKLQKDRQGVATCQQRLFRNQMETLFLSLSSSISLWPRYLCSLKSLAQLGPFHSSASPEYTRIISVDQGISSLVSCCLL